MKEHRFHLIIMTILLAFLYLAQTAHTASQEVIDAAQGQSSPEGIGPAPIKPVQPAPESLQEDIPDWRARWELARLLSYARRYEESLAEYKTVLQEKPDLWKAKIEMAQVMFWSGRQSEASKVLEEIPAEHADEKAKLLLADIYVAQKSFNKAEPIYRAYLKSQSKDYEVAVKLADVLSWTKRYEEAIGLYKDVLNALPDDVQIRRKYAYVLIWAGKQTEAAAELKKTLKK